jgi:hypothetical protein
MSSARIIIGIISFSVGMTAIFAGNMFTIMMIGEINRKRQEEDLVSYFGYTPLKIIRIFREYRRLYTYGKLHVLTFAALALAFIGVLGAAIAFHIIG